MNTRRRLLLSAPICLLLIACGTGAPNPSATQPPTRTVPPQATIVPVPSPTPTPAPTQAAAVGSAAQAAALVFESDPRWAEITALQPDLIGASLWYEAFPALDGGFSVTITAGSGDCMAGCINQRRFIYHVDRDGTVGLDREEGDEVELSNPVPGTGPARAVVSLTAGPVCPVEQVPPDPACDPRPVQNASVTVYAADGTEIGTTTSGEEGTVAFELEPGAYYVVAQPVEGLMGTPDAQAFAVVGGSQAGLSMVYDTGIR